jgi:molybdate transport system permease protein
VRAERLFWVAAAAALALVLVFIALPLVAIFTDVAPGRVISELGDSSSREALRLSIETSAIALALILGLGTPAAYLLARRRFRGRSLLLTLIELPLVLPPAAAGIALLASLGPHGVIGGPLRDAGFTPLSTAGVVIALAFVSSPFYLRAAEAAFDGLDPSLLDAARTLGAGPARVFARVAVPTARQGLAAGAGLAFARALGEFGATLLFAGSFPGVTQTVPLAIYDRFATDFPGAIALSAVLVCVSAALLLVIKLALGSAAR